MKLPYPDKRESKRVFEENADFTNRISEVLENHLEMEFWTDEDEDGVYGCASLDLDYIDEDTEIEYVLKGGDFKMAKWNEDSKKWEPIELTSDEMLVVALLLDESEEVAKEEAADAEDYQRDPYSYYGVSRSDFF